MTNIPSDDTRLLVLFGEMRGDLKSLLRSQQELAARISENEDHVADRLAGLDKRVKSLEAVRLKVAGFVFAVSMIATATSDKIANGIKSVGNFFLGG